MPSAPPLARYLVPWIEKIRDEGYTVDVQADPDGYSVFIHKSDALLSPPMIEIKDERSLARALQRANAAFKRATSSRSGDRS